MNEQLNATHDPRAWSWIASANTPGTDFPIQNLPFGVFREKAGTTAPRVGVAIGDHVLGVARCAREGVFTGLAAEAAAACEAAGLNPLLTLGPPHWSALRRALFDLFNGDHPQADRRHDLVGPFLVPLEHVDLLLPAAIGGYTDFYASVFHATNVGRMMRPDTPLLPNYKFVPIGYHGRASSVVVSGTPVRRPCGQTRPEGADTPVFGPSNRLDYELEVGVFIGPGNVLGQPISIDEIENHLFGLCLVNDWSARDMQAWEYQPLGPFLAKNFATTVSPWVVTMESRAPLRVPAFQRPEGDPVPLPYLDSRTCRDRGGIDLALAVHVRTARMREQGVPPVRLSHSNLRDLYWTMGQLATHHASNGCNLQPGDLLASGTVSGPTKDSRGCLLELTWRGSDPIDLPTGERRAFLEDGDEVMLSGRCERDGAAPIGFGECRGLVLPA